MSAQVDVTKAHGVAQGMAVNVVIAVKDPVTLAPVNLTGYQLEWTLYTSAVEGRTVLIASKTAAITMTNVDGTNDGAVIPLAHDDTMSALGVQAVAPGTWWHELWRKNAGSERLLAYGTFVLLASARRL